jgi:V/A-type H+-transporting ATPase subunit E
MSLQAILARIQAAGQEKVQEIEQQAYIQANAILAEARMEASEIEEEACAAAASPAMRERSRIIHRARQESLHMIGDVREGLVDAALHQIRGRLSGIRRDAAYPQVLARFVEEALAELQGSLEETGKVRLEADQRDKTLLESILIRLGLDLEVDNELDCWGGVIAKSEDGRVVVINTLESRLEYAIPYLRRSLSALFEAEMEEAEPCQSGERAYVD